jgi:cobalt-zinc-cadmium efflux system membrane fusion protein
MRTYVRRLAALVLTALASACGSDATAPETAPAEDPPAIAVTIWSDKTELFMEHPPLVAGADARFAIHLTNLSDFTPLRDGKVVVRFEGDTIHRFEVDGPSTPGIFGVDVKVPAARRYQLAVEVHSAKLSDDLRAGPATVYPDQSAAAAAIAADEEGATSFLKEQQWTLDFATMPVESQARREVLTVPGTIEPRVGGSAEVRAPAPGRIAAGGGRPIGAFVARGSTLAEIIVRNDRLG